MLTNKQRQCTDPARLVSVDNVFALVTVECEDEQHKIAVLNSGSLHFYDHDASLQLEDFGLREAGEGPKHRCGEIYRRWIQGRTHRLPEGLCEAYTKLAETKQSQRSEHRCYDHGRDDRPKGRKERLAQDVECAQCSKCRGGDPLLVSVGSRLTDRVRDTAYEHLIASEAYRTSEYRHRWHLDIGDSCDVSSSMEREWDSCDEKSHPVTAIAATVKRSWLIHVAKEGFTHVAGGHFVLDILEKRKDGQLVILAIKQSRGYGVVKSAALYNPKTDKLRWY